MGALKFYVAEVNMPNYSPSFPNVTIGALHIMPATANTITESFMVGLSTQWSKCSWRLHLLLKPYVLLPFIKFTSDYCDLPTAVGYSSNSSYIVEHNTPWGLAQVFHYHIHRSCTLSVGWGGAGDGGRCRREHRAIRVANLGKKLREHGRYQLAGYEQEYVSLYGFGLTSWKFMYAGYEFTWNCVRAKLNLPSQWFHQFGWKIDCPQLWWYPHQHCYLLWGSHWSHSECLGLRIRSHLETRERRLSYYLKCTGQL